MWESVGMMGRWGAYGTGNSRLLMTVCERVWVWWEGEVLTAQVILDRWWLCVSECRYIGGWSAYGTDNFWLLMTMCEIVQVWWDIVTVMHTHTHTKACTRTHTQSHGHTYMHIHTYWGDEMLTENICWLTHKRTHTGVMKCLQQTHTLTSHMHAGTHARTHTHTCILGWWHAHSERKLTLSPPPTCGRSWSQITRARSRCTSARRLAWRATWASWSRRCGDSQRSAGRRSLATTTSTAWWECSNSSRLASLRRWSPTSATMPQTRRKHWGQSTSLSFPPISPPPCPTHTSPLPPLLGSSGDIWLILRLSR